MEMNQLEQWPFLTIFKLYAIQRALAAYKSIQI